MDLFLLLFFLLLLLLGLLFLLLLLLLFLLFLLLLLFLLFGLVFLLVVGRLLNVGRDLVSEEVLVDWLASFEVGLSAIGVLNITGEWVNQLLLSLLPCLLLLLRSFLAGLFGILGSLDLGSGNLSLSSNLFAVIFVTLGLRHSIDLALFESNFALNWLTSLKIGLSTIWVLNDTSEWVLQLLLPGFSLGLSFLVLFVCVVGLDLLVGISSHFGGSSNLSLSVFGLAV